MRLNGLAKGLAAFGSGYISATDKRIEQERQEKRDAMLDEQFQWQREQADEQRRERDKKSAIEREIENVGRAGELENNVAAVAYTNDAGEQRTAYQPDMQAAQFAAQQQAMETGQPMPGTQPVEGAAPAPQAEQASSVRALDGSRKLFTGLNAASDAAKFAQENPNTPYARYMALSERLSKMAGGQEMADKYLERAKKAEREGAFQTLSLLEAGDTQGALKSWNSTGAVKLGASQSFRTVEQGGRKVHQVVEGDKVVVPDVESAMLRYISGIEGVSAQSKARAESAAKIREELLKPYTLRPGEKRQVYDPASGKVVTIGEGSIPAGYEVMIDGQGNTTLRKIDGGSSTKPGKANDPLAAVTESIMESIDKSAAKGALEPGQISEAKRIGRQLVFNASQSRKNLDQSVAEVISIGVATGKMAPSKQFDPDTGRIGNAVEYQGNKFVVEDFGAPGNTHLKPQEVAPVLGGFLDSLSPQNRSALIAAAYNPQARADVEQKIVKAVRKPEWATSFKQQKGREPSESDIQLDIANRISSLDAQANLISRYGDSDKVIGGLIARTLREAGYTPDGKGRLPAQQPGAAATGSRVQQPGGLYAPDPSSPAGRARASQERARAEAAARDQRRTREQAELSRQFAADLASMDPLSLAQKYDRLRGSLPAADAAELQRIERQIR